MRTQDFGSSVKRLLAAALIAFGVLGWTSSAVAQPAPPPGGTEADIVQEGDNAGNSTQAGTAASGDGAAGSQITGIVSEPGSTTSVSNSNTSEDSESTSGDVTVTNVQSVEAGPRVSGAIADTCGSLAASLEGPIAACVVQDGDNDVDAAQNSAGTSGDALAGAQVTGIVNGGDTVAVDLENIAEDAESTSGDADTVQDLFGQAGPVAADVIAVGGGDAASITGPVDALIVQEGDNEVSGEQEAAAGSGDAVGGSQVAGAVASGAGNIAITATQESEDAEAVTGDAFADNSDPLFAGDVLGSAVRIGGSALRGKGFTQSIEGPVTGAGIVHEGDNTVDSLQSAAATTGDAVAGGQVVGVVSAGDADLTLDNTSDGDQATSGDSDAVNDVDAAFAGNIYGLGEGAGVDITPASISDVTTLEGGVVHEGDNDSALAQDASAASGDAVAGAQIAGGVIGAGGSFTADATNASEDSESTSGDAAATNLADAIFAGNIGTDGNITFSSIEGVTGAGVVHDGDNETDAAETADAATGDAVTGASIIGIVGSGDASIVTDNTTEDAEATTGDADSTNDIDVAASGNLFSDAGEIDAPDDASIEDVETTEGGIVHEGDNTTELALTTGTATGDAVAGGQIAGAVTAAGGSFAADLTNSSEDDQADSGAADADTFVNAALSGNLSGDEDVQLGSISGGTGVGIVQDGDNDVAADLTAGGVTGDAVAGGQVVGGVGAGDASVTLDNTSEDGEATSGDVTSFVDSLGVLFAGNAFAEEDDIDIDPGTLSIEGIDGAENAIVHDGDNELDAALQASGETGDAVAGGQVAGVVTAAGGSVAIDGTNTAEDAQATSGDTDVEGHLDIGVAGNLSAGEGVFAGVGEAAISDVTGDAGIVHEGDNELSVSETVTGASGDAVGGGQIFGTVAAGDVSIVADNTSEDAEATSGNAFGVTDVDVALAGNSQSDQGDVEVDVDSIEGPLVLNGNGIVQDGDNSSDIGLSASTATGDAVAGGQVAGVVSGAGGSTAIDATNESDGDEATSGESDAIADVESAVAGNLSADGSVFVSSIDADITDGAIVHDGDNDLSIDGDASAASGDAVGGGQIFGAVGAGDVDIVASNTSEDSEATSGDGLATTVVETALVGNVVAQEGFVDLSSIDGTITGVEIVHEGDNALDIGQQAAAASGDAVGGGQIVGAVTSAGGSLSVDTTNTSEDAESTSGDATADERVESAFVGNLFSAGELEVGGAAIDADISGAAIVLDGDNDGTIDQSLDVATGDAVAGGQVIGAVVTGGTADVVQDNTSEDDQTTTGDATGTKLLDAFVIGPVVADAIVSGGEGGAG